MKTANRIAGKVPTDDPLATLASLNVEKLREQREALEKERDEATAAFTNKIEAIKVLEKAAYIRDHGKPPKKARVPREPKKGTASPQNGHQPGQGTCKERIAKYLSVNQPAKAAVMAADLGIPMGTIYATMSANKDLFEQAPNDAGWRLKRPPRDDD